MTSATPAEDGRPNIPATKTARHGLIRQILTRTAIRSQGELASELADAGVHVTQATLSRDLVELRAEKLRLADGSRIYQVPREGPAKPVTSPDQPEMLAARLARLCAELLVTAEATANLVVLRTPPGGAHFLASAIDNAMLPGIMGSVAGNDSVLIITRDPDGGAEVAQRLLALAPTEA